MKALASLEIRFICILVLTGSWPSLFSISIAEIVFRNCGAFNNALCFPISDCPLTERDYLKLCFQLRVQDILMWHIGFTRRVFHLDIYEVISVKSPAKTGRGEHFKLLDPFSPHYGKVDIIIHSKLRRPNFQPNALSERLHLVNRSPM